MGIQDTIFGAETAEIEKSDFTLLMEEAILIAVTILEILFVGVVIAAFIVATIRDIRKWRKK